MFARINNGEIDFAPINFITPTGETIINFNQSPHDMEEQGFSEIIDNEMPCDGNDYTFQYEIREGKITKIWEVVTPEEDEEEYPDMQGGF